MASSEEALPRLYEVPRSRLVIVTSGRETNFCFSFDWKKVPNVASLVFGLRCSHQGI